MFSGLRYFSQLEPLVIPIGGYLLPGNILLFLHDPQQRAPVSCASHQPKCIIFIKKKDKEYLYLAGEPHVENGRCTRVMACSPKNTFSRV